MPLVLGGIRFESFPAVWAEEKIYTNFTYAQCVEIEEYHDKYYTNGHIGFEQSSLTLIHSNLTYEQCLELEGHYDNYYAMKVEKKQNKASV